MLSIVVTGTGIAAIVGGYSLFLKNIIDKSKPKDNLKDAIKKARETIFQKDEFEKIFKELDVVTINTEGKEEIPYIERKFISDYYNIYILNVPTKLYIEDIQKCKEDIQKKLKTQIHINRDEQTSQIFICEKIKY
ncbi:hypothetical protein [Paraclostridium bifermentans]|uniref:hypothetical protein n=1 Tax=Paraclostridium bifermentans TaxID=1490 RepID=UPI000400BB0F|nr:hypothetical protein [Paraclostridium bifermentans]